MQETLDAVPMRTIDSYFRIPQHHQQAEESSARQQGNHSLSPAAGAVNGHTSVQATSVVAEKQKKMRICYEMIQEILNRSNSNFSRLSMVQYLTIQNCLRL